MVHWQEGEGQKGKTKMQMKLGNTELSKVKQESHMTMHTMPACFVSFKLLFIKHILCGFSL